MDSFLYTQYVLEYKNMIKLAILNSDKTKLSINEIATSMVKNKLDRCIVDYETPSKDA